MVSLGGGTLDGGGAEVVLKNNSKEQSQISGKPNCDECDEKGS